MNFYAYRRFQEETPVDEEKYSNPGDRIKNLFWRWLNTLTSAER